jgi:TRAP transporter TAXI family solute receptor
MPVAGPNLNRRNLVYALVPVLMSLLLLGAAAWYFYLRAPQPMTLRIAAGEKGAEAFDLIKSISEVAHQSGSALIVQVIPTAGSSENMSLLARGDADLATVQADAVFPQGLSLIARLYPDFFQLLARPESSMRDFGDVAGKRIALADQSSGQYRSFWLLANHYGLPAERISVTTVTGVDLINRLRDGSIDGVFRVRASRNRELRQIADNTQTVFVPIAQGNAIHLRYPALNAAILPHGAYRGMPALPAFDLPTVSIDQLLVSRGDADPAAIRELTSILFEKRRDLAQRSNLAGLIKAPDLDSGTLLPVHEGAVAYYDREKPSFLEQNSDLIGVLLSIAAVLTSIGLWIKRRLEEGRKGRIDVYNLQLAQLSEDIGRTFSSDELANQRTRLYAMLNKVIRDLDEDKVAQEGFHTFAFTWGAVQKAIDDQRGVLQSSQQKRGKLRK